MLKDKKGEIRKLQKEIQNIQNQYIYNNSETLYEYLLVLNNRLDRIK
jgi:hypothetical protein